MNQEQNHHFSIPTIYGGIKFRSRLEAAHAQWFDEHEMIWAYESEGFNLDGLWYLPDFWLPEYNAIVEVKGILDDSLEKVYALNRICQPRKIYVLVSMAPAGKNWFVVLQEINWDGKIIRSDRLSSCPPPRKENRLPSYG